MQYIQNITILTKNHCKTLFDISHSFLHAVFGILCVCFTLKVRVSIRTSPAPSTQQLLVSGDHCAGQSRSDLSTLSPHLGFSYILPIRPLTSPDNSYSPPTHHRGLS